jgi:hypothetical protein
MSNPVKRLVPVRRFPNLQLFVMTSFLFLLAAPGVGVLMFVVNLPEIPRPW